MMIMMMAMMMMIGDDDDDVASGGGQGVGHSARFTHKGNFYLMDNPTSVLFRINSMMRILFWFHHHYKRHCHRVDIRKHCHRVDIRKTLPSC